MTSLKTLLIALVTAALLGAGGGAVMADDVADNQGFCKKQGSSSCSGASECAGPHADLLPRGQAKKC